MRPEEPLKVLRVQYHDFLNCLQVISGLLELGRHERIKEYLGRVAEEFTARGRVAKAGLPGLAWVLLRFQAEGGAAGVKVFCDLEKVPPRESPGGEETLVACLEELHAAIAARAAGTREEYLITITGRNVPGGYLLTYAGAFPWEEIAEAVAETVFNGTRISYKAFGSERLEIFWRFATGEERCFTIT